MEEGFLYADGFDDALVGFCGDSRRLIYSVTMCLEILMERMSAEEAIEYFDYHVLGSWVGGQTPIWCYDMPLP